jgi:hypothetical protein
MSRIFSAFSALPNAVPVVPPTGFPTDARKLRQWVDTLPRANAEATLKLVHQALACLHGLAWRGAVRAEALDILRPLAYDVMAPLSVKLRNAALPLAPNLVAATKAVEAMHMLLAHGYRQAVAELCAPDGKVPMLKGALVTNVLHRACSHFALALAQAWRSYRAPPAQAWQSLHRSYAFAQLLRLDTKVVDDNLSARSSSTRQIYLQSLLMALANPYAFAQAEQEALWHLALDYGIRLPVAGERPEGVSLALGADADRAFADDDVSVREWIDVSPLLADLQAAVAGASGETVYLSHQGSLPLDRRLAERWLQSLAASVTRNSLRLPGGHVLDTVLGMSSVHSYLNGGRNFSEFLQHLHQQQTTMAGNTSASFPGNDVTHARMLPARVLDQSQSGYRVSWPAEAQARVRIGELVALALHAESLQSRTWLLGTVRWLRYEDSDEVSAGIELLGLRAWPIALTPESGKAGKAQPLRAIEFVAGPGGNPRHGIIVAATAHVVLDGATVHRLDDDPSWLLHAQHHVIAANGPLRLVGETGEYAVLSHEALVNNNSSEELSA